MKKTILVLATAAALPLATAWAGSEGSVAGEILELERRALDGWRTGDRPQLAIVDPGSHIHSAAAATRINGSVPLQKLYNGFRGMRCSTYDNPHVRTSEDSGPDLPPHVAGPR
jgi:hypothetical protein